MSHFLLLLWSSGAKTSQSRFLPRSYHRTSQGLLENRGSSLQVRVQHVCVDLARDSNVRMTQLLLGKF